MKHVAFLLFVALHVAAETPEVILPKTKELRPIAWYTEQAALWKQEVSRNAKNANAWLNYYSASKFSLDVQNDLDRIVSGMEMNIPDSYEYFLAKGLNEGLTDAGYADIKKAYQLNTERPETYATLISFAELNLDRTTRKEFSKKLFASGLVAQSLMNYNYNVLMSIDRLGVLFTDSENTTLPIFLLQDVLNVGNEVIVLNLDLLTNTTYCNKKLQSTNLKLNQSLERNDQLQLLCSQLPLENSDKYFYYALTLPKDYIMSSKDNLYVVGLASVFSQTRFDNLLLIEQNMGNRFLMDYLRVDFDKEGEFGSGKVLSSNYYVPMILFDRIAQNIDHHAFQFDLNKSIEKLNHDEKSLFVLRYELEKNVQDIAFILECPEGTVKSRLFYLRKKLSAQLQSYKPIFD
jgi:RNA polymerase sigma factor (sigma-70 family)